MTETSINKESPSSSQPQGDADLFNEAVCNLQQAILLQSKSQRRVATRVKFLIRSIMVGLVSALIFISYLAYLFLHQVTVLTNSLDNISLETTGLYESIEDIERDMMKFEAAMDELPHIGSSILTVNTNLSLMTSSVGEMTQHITTVKGELQGLASSLSGVSKNVQVLDASVNQMKVDINEVTKPVKRFNDFNPFNMLR